MRSLFSGVHEPFPTSDGYGRWISSGREEAIGYKGEEEVQLTGALFPRSEVLRGGGAGSSARDEERGM